MSQSKFTASERADKYVLSLEQAIYKSSEAGNPAKFLECVA